MKILVILIVVIAILGAIFVPQFLYIVDETQVIVPADMEQEEVALQFEKYDLTTAGVVDAQGKLIGMITVDDVMEVAREEFEEDVLLLGGVGEETVDDGVLQASAKRLR